MFHVEHFWGRTAGLGLQSPDRTRFLQGWDLAKSAVLGEPGAAKKRNVPRGTFVTFTTGVGDVWRRICAKCARHPGSESRKPATLRCILSETGPASGSRGRAPISGDRTGGTERI